VLVRGQRITGKKRAGIIPHMGHARAQHIRPGLVAFADHASQPQAPHWRTRKPYPGVSVGRARELGPRPMRFFGRHATPQRVAWAFGDVEVVPSGEQDHATVACDTLEPGTNRSFVHVDEPCCGTQRMAFRSRPPRHRDQRPGNLQAVIRGAVAQGHPPSTRVATGLRFTAAAAIVHQEPCGQGLPVASTISVRTISRFPVHPSRLDACAVAIEEVMLA
jgi:hypothetical protein